MKIESILANFGPMTTSRAAQILQREGVSYEAARQRVNRRGPTVRTLHRLPFPKRARFIYLDSQFDTDRYWSALNKAIHESNPPYAAALAGLRARGGVCLRKHFEILSGAPILQKGHVASSAILKRLEEVRLVESLEIDGIGSCIALRGMGSDALYESKRLRARLLTEGVLLDAIRLWAGRMNMASPGTTAIRDEVPAPNFATFRFDLTGPSYLRPLLTWKTAKPDPGFLVADVLLDQELDIDMVSPFLRKCATLAALKNARPFIPMLIADSFTPEALRECRSRGVIATRPETVFGQDVARALEDLIQVLTNAASADSDKLERIFKKLSAIEGEAGNLRGALFELIVGYCVKELEGGEVDIGKVVRNSETAKSAEIDVLCHKQRTVRIYECKGYQPTAVVRSDEIERWLKHSIPIIYSTLKREPQFWDVSFAFEFWTTSSFDETSLAMLEESQGAHAQILDRLEGRQGAARLCSRAVVTRHQEDSRRSLFQSSSDQE